MSAAIILELCMRWCPGGGPEVAAARVPKIKVPAACIGRRIVVAVPREPPEPGIAIERVAACSVRNDAKEILAAQVIDPGQRSIRSRDHVLAIPIVKAAEAGRCPSFAGGSRGA